MGVIAALPTAGRAVALSQSDAGVPGAHAVDVPVPTAPCGRRVAYGVPRVPALPTAAPVAEAVGLPTALAPRRTNLPVDAVERNGRALPPAGRGQGVLTRAQGGAVKGAPFSCLLPLVSAGRPTASADAAATEVAVAVQAPEVATPSTARVAVAWPAVPRAEAGRAAAVGAPVLPARGAAFLDRVRVPTACPSP